MLCKIQSHCKDNTFPIPDWTWIVAKLELDWTWIETTTTLHQRRNGRNTCYNIELFHNHKNKKVFFAIFLSPATLIDNQGVKWWQILFFLSPSCHQRIFNINIRCKFWWQVRKHLSPPNKLILSECCRWQENRKKLFLVNSSNSRYLESKSGVDLLV